MDADANLLTVVCKRQELSDITVYPAATAVIKRPFRPRHAFFASKWLTAHTFPGEDAVLHANKSYGSECGLHIYVAGLSGGGSERGPGAIGHVIIVALIIIIVRHRHDWVRFVWPLRCCRITGCLPLDGWPSWLVIKIEIVINSFVRPTFKDYCIIATRTRQS